MLTDNLNYIFSTVRQYKSSQHNQINDVKGMQYHSLKLKTFWRDLLQFQLIFQIYSSMSAKSNDHFAPLLSFVNITSIRLYNTFFSLKHHTTAIQQQINYQQLTSFILLPMVEANSSAPQNGIIRNGSGSLVFWLLRQTRRDRDTL